MSTINNVSSQSASVSQSGDTPQVSNDDKNAFKEALHQKSSGTNEEKLKNLFNKSEKALSASILKNQENALGESGDGAKLPSDKVSAESMMNSLFSPQNQGNMPTSKEVAPTQASTGLSSESVQDIADRILTATKADGSQEVRISLSDKALAGTEVSITRSNDGQISVQFSTNNVNSFQTLVAAQDALKEALSQSNDDVKVEIHKEDNNSDRESQGKFAYNNQEDED